MTLTGTELVGSQFEVTANWAVVQFETSARPGEGVPTLPIMTNYVSGEPAPPRQLVHFPADNRALRRFDLRPSAPCAQHICPVRSASTNRRAGRPCNRRSRNSSASGT
jgi:hypothetical protein